MDVPSPDAPTDYTYPDHILLLNRNILIMENVNIVPSLPPRDFRVHSSPLRIQGGTGVQTRIYAMLYERMNDSSGRLSSQSWLSLFLFLYVVSSVLKNLTE
ncbi:cyclase [Elysia marginata]|uniref:Cyclase n=1 Tax=Elysia marginata TaxID=1093978 RepID=A0AAV4G8J2_9GAST|nr:cyclase [Elysia marginata]